MNVLCTATSRRFSLLKSFVSKINTNRRATIFKLYLEKAEKLLPNAYEPKKSSSSLKTGRSALEPSVDPIQISIPESSEDTSDKMVPSKRPARKSKLTPTTTRTSPSPNKKSKTSISENNTSIAEPSTSKQAYKNSNSGPGPSKSNKKPPVSAKKKDQVSKKQLLKKSIAAPANSDTSESLIASAAQNVVDPNLSFAERIVQQRVQFAAGFGKFPFEKSRCKMITKQLHLPEKHNGIVYWMSRDQRVQDNWALLYAQRLAMKDKVPLFVCFFLVPKFLQATLRQYAFMLKGLTFVREDLHKLNIPFYLLFGEGKEIIPKFVKDHKIGGVVTDMAPLRVPRHWTEELATKLPPDVPLCQVDAHNIIPLWVTSDKLEYAARTIRTKIHKNLDKYLTEFPPVVKHPYMEIKLSDVPNVFEDWEQLISLLEIDKTIEEVDWARPGMEEGIKVLETFLEKKIAHFHDKRNDPNVDCLSNLSPWFHFGQISVARCILEVKKSRHKEGAKVFIEEAVVRRELSDNFCYYNENYDSLEGASNWARTTLNLHRKDKRKPLYTLEQLEAEKTYDDLWNAAQTQLRVEGKMHGFLRMYWAKKILEWTESPEKALEIAILLNDKYNLDGRDPNGYVGCMWSICGIHDQGWRERTIFGKIRYMNYEGCKRKFDVPAFVLKYKRFKRST